MIPHPQITFGAGAADSTITPIGLIAMLVAIGLVLVLPRRRVIVPLLFLEMLVPLGQGFVVGGVHLYVDRVVILVACLRFLIRSGSPQRAFAGGVTSIDKVFLIWALWRATAFVLLYHVGGAVVNQFGFLWDALGGYFLVRCLIRDVDDILVSAKALVLIAVIIASCMLYEHFKMVNIFSLLMGGKVIPDIRGGRLRCRGPFEQEIIASVFGGTLVPFFLWLWTTPKSRFAAALGLISSAIITITASSSTGIAAAAAGTGALCLWPLRKRVRWILWGALAMIVAFAIVMKAPVWFILDRVDFVGGSTGWDRANLINQCVNHFGSWWLVGTADNATWGFFTWDLCNQFVAEAVQGGLATLILFSVLIIRTFRRIGSIRKLAGHRSQEWMVWAIGCILFAHVAGFMGISYFDQIRNWWYFTLAMIPAAALTIQASNAALAEAELVSPPTAAEYAGRAAAAAGAANEQLIGLSVSRRFSD